MTNQATTNVDLDRLIHPDEAVRIVLQHARPLPSEEVPLAKAFGRILEEEVVSAEDHPPFAASTMDGYAVTSDDPSPWREVIGTQHAGTALDFEVTDGYTVKIMTGAPVPKGADAVVRIESTEVVEDHVVVTQTSITSGENIRPIGFDLKAGDRILPAGTRLGAAEIGLLAGLGIASVPARRIPRVSVISTGDELKDPGEPLQPGQIRDSNRFMLAAAMEAAGSEVVWVGKAPDERQQLEALLRDRVANSDVVLTSGGVSMGDLDLVKAILSDIATVHFRRIFLKPGKPLNFATSGDTLIFGLPGNPVSALVAVELFIKPALTALAGGAAAARPRVVVTLEESTNPTDRIEFQRATVRVDETGRLLAKSTGNQASSRLASFLGANALIVIPPRDRRYEAGETVEAILLDQPAASI